MQKGKTACVTGGTGFIGHHMARRLRAEGYWVRVVDIKPYEYGPHDFADEVLIYDLTNPQNVDAVLRNADRFSYYPAPFEKRIPFDEVYNFACVMGGAGFVFTGEHDAQIMQESALINLNIANACHQYGIGKLFYSSSACVYPQHLQNDYHNDGLRESDAWPADPDSCYGLEKLFSERLYLAYARNYGLNVRIARFHNIYGPEGTYQGGKEKAPAAMCRKVIEAENEVEVWGTGHQTRSFLYIDDCIDAVRLLMESDHKDPINIGSEEIVTINQLAKIAIGLSGKIIHIKNITGPTGVMGRNSNNEIIKKVLGWSPKVDLMLGMSRTFKWIKSQYDGR